MNQKEIAELRRQFKKSNNQFAINQTATAYYAMEDGSPVLKTFTIQDFEDFSEGEQNLYHKLFKKVLSGKLGRQLTEFEFRADSPRRQQLYDLNKDRLHDTDTVKAFLDMMIQNTSYINGVCITLASCEYQVPAKDRNGEPIPGGDIHSYKFLICSVNELSLTEIGLWYNPDTTQIERKEDTDLQVQPASLDGFVFPAFLDGAADVNHILYYTKTPKRPNEPFIENILENEVPLSFDKQTQGFAALLSESAQGELDLALLTNIYANVQERALEAQEEGETLKLDKNQVKTILEQAGLSDIHVQNVPALYEKELGSEPLDANNTNSDTLNIKLPNISVTLKKDAVKKASTRAIDGKQCLVIEMDEAMLANGLELNK